MKRGRLRLFSLVALTFFAVFVSNPAKAQLLTYYYTGPSFDLADCTLGAPPCIAGGSVNGSITYWGVPYNYTGYVHANQVVASTASASGFGTLTNSVVNADLYLSSGAVISWDWENSTGSSLPQTQVNTSVVSDGASISTPGIGVTKEGIVKQTSTSYGTWFSPIALGATCAAEAPSDAPPLPGKGSCGDPCRCRQRQSLSVRAGLFDSRAEPARLHTLLQQLQRAGHLRRHAWKQLAAYLRPLSAHHQSVRRLWRDGGARNRPVHQLFVQFRHLHARQRC